MFIKSRIHPREYGPKTAVLRRFLDRFLTLGFAAIFVVALGEAHAHQLGEGYLFLLIHADKIEGRIEATVADLHRKIPLDANGDGKVTEPEAMAKAGELQAYVASQVRLLQGGAAIPMTFAAPGFHKIALGQYMAFPFASPALSPVPDAVTIDYRLLFEVDPSQRGRVVIEQNVKTGVANNAERVALDFHVGDEPKELDLTMIDTFGSALGRFIKEGVTHIWIGVDHILFLAALLLPAVLALQGRRWEPVGSFRSALWNVVKIITCFTIAHSITLSLAALGVVHLPSRFVESIIALSVLLAALNNLWPVMRDKVWEIVFVFGLFHGFGFASVFGDLLSGSSLVTPLVGFNVGVELGQIAIVIVLFPLLYFARRWPKLYVRGVLHGGSAVIALMAINWLLERACDVHLLGPAQ